VIKYLITGGSGFIGRNLIDELESVGLRDPDDFAVIDVNPHNAYCIEQDLCDSVPTTKAENIVHLAAVTDVRKSIENPSVSFLDNCFSTVNVLTLAKESGATSFAFASSVGAPQACSPYGASKLAGEAACRAYRESYGLSIHILRLANVYGPYSSHKSSVIAKFIKKLIKKEPLQIYGEGIQSRDFIYVSDVAECLTSLNLYNSDLLVATGRQTSILTLVEMLTSLSEKLLGYTPEVEYAPAIRGEVLHSSPLSNIKTKVGLEDGLERTFNWFLTNGTEDA
jgi:UDP-glucose 4-epimerase